MLVKVFLIAALMTLACARQVGHRHSSQNNVQRESNEQTKVASHHKEHHGHASSAQSIKQHHDRHLTKHIEYYRHPKCEFTYEVKDPHTHDFKYQHEALNGDVVKGVYSLLQPDGAVRIVKYHADKKSGFNADVKHEPHAKNIILEHH